MSKDEMPKVIWAVTTKQDWPQRRWHDTRYLYANSVKYIRADTVPDLTQDDRKRLEYLEDAFELARTYGGYEARACPLCTYENGVFVESCSMHKRIDELEHRLADAPELTQEQRDLLELVELAKQREFPEETLVRIIGGKSSVALDNRYETRRLSNAIAELRRRLKPDKPTAETLMAAIRQYIESDDDGTWEDRYTVLLDVQSQWEAAERMEAEHGES